MARRQAVCFACPPSKSAPQAVDSHHVVPVEYGGPEDGKRVDICPSCHDLVHNTAEHKAKTGEVNAQLTKNQTILVNYIVRAKLEFQASGKAKSDTARNNVAVSFSNDELKALHALKTAAGFRSLDRYIKHLVFQEIMNQRASRR